ncbi:MAG: hypothetical protein AB8F95_13890 [Bacteroidia bacterium]
MRKIFILTLLIVAFSCKVSATNIDSINLQLRSLFGNLAKPAPAKLFNWDMAVHMVDSSLFVPANTVDTLNIDRWSQMYTEMRNSAYDTTAWQPFDDVLNSSLQYRGDTINILTMFWDYYRFKPNALNTNTYFNFDTINNILTDKFPRPGYPYDEYTVFAASPNRYKTRFQSTTFRIGTDNLFFDNFHPLIASNPQNYTMKANFHDGSGWHNVTLGIDNYFHVIFPSAGEYPIEIVVESKRRRGIIAKSVSRITAPKLRAGVNDIPDSQLSLFGMELNVYEPCSSQSPQHEKTLIYVEGLDVMDFIPSMNRDADEIYLSQVRDPGIADLRNFGYRIIVVDWQNSRIDMHDNADNLIQLLDHLKCGGIIGDGTIEQFVIMAESMGGIVANLALLKMESGNHQSPCQQDKEHNVRLLVTNDSPFSGAHIPMSIQKMARFIQNNATLATGVINPLLPILVKQQFRANNILLDGTAAKQLLMNHVSNVSFLGVPNYYQHSKRGDFLQDVQALGTHPRHCKIVAMSDGNMLGLGQTRYWDGDDRQAGDALLHARTTLHGTILGRRFNLIQGNIELNTDPNGIGDLGNLNAGTWWVKIRLKWFGLRFYTGFNSALLRDWDGNMRPVSTAAGGMLEYNNIIRTGLVNNFNLAYQGSGVWRNNSPNKWGWDTRVRTDGFHWNFIPVSSAFDFGFGLSIPFDNMSISSFMTPGRIPFDVIYGVPGNTVSFSNQTNPAFFGVHPYIRNRHHVDVINDVLTDNALAPNAQRIYTYPCPPGSPLPSRFVQMLNKEMGDEEIYLTNRTLPCHSSFSFTEAVIVNQNNPFYNYPSGWSTVDALPSVYSKEEPFIISGNGMAEFNTTTGNVQYSPPFSGPYYSPIFTFQPCCENFYKKAKTPVLAELDPNEITIFPNPTDEHFVMNFFPEKKGDLVYKILDMQGRLILKGDHRVENGGSAFYLPVKLPDGIPAGQYVIVAQFNNKHFANKLAVKR